MGSLYLEYTISIERLQQESQSCIHLLEDKYQSERRKVMQQQTSGLEHLFKQCQAMFSTLGKLSIVRHLLKNKGQFLRCCKLSDQFYNANIQFHDGTVKTDSLIARGARSTNVKSALPKDREMKDVME